jgi:hypothetical protein
MDINSYWSNRGCFVSRGCAYLSSEFGCYVGFSVAVGVACACRVGWVGVGCHACCIVVEEWRRIGFLPFSLSTRLTTAC